MLKKMLGVALAITLLGGVALGDFVQAEYDALVVARDAAKAVLDAAGDAATADQIAAYVTPVSLIRCYPHKALTTCESKEALDTSISGLKGCYSEVNVQATVVGAVTVLRAAAKIPVVDIDAILEREAGAAARDGSLMNQTLYAQGGSLCTAIRNNIYTTKSIQIYCTSLHAEAFYMRKAVAGDKAVDYQVNRPERGVLFTYNLDLLPDDAARVEALRGLHSRHTDLRLALRAFVPVLPGNLDSSRRYTRSYVEMVVGTYMDDKVAAKAALAPVRAALILALNDSGTPEAQAALAKDALTDLYLRYDALGIER